MGLSKRQKDRRACKRKKRFVSQWFAEYRLSQSIKIWQKEGQRVDIDDFNVYPCSNCGGWHIGNKVKKV